MADGPTIIIKKIKKVQAAGHHGGAWKVAYADFVTAMMAFFLLMWLVNATSVEQKQGIADYFSPSAVSLSSSGAGGLLGGNSFDTDGARDSGQSSITMKSRASGQKGGGSADGENDGGSSSSDSQPTESAFERAMAAKEEAEFERVAQSLRQAMNEMPELTELSKHIIIDQTPEGLRIQIVDQEGRSMFPAGKAEPYERTKKLFAQVAKVIGKLPNRVSISGHTDSAKFVREDGYSSWELSADRANATRSIFQKAGLDEDRIYQVAGKAGSEPLFPDDPYMSANRRISVILLKEAPVLPPDHKL